MAASHACCYSNELRRAFTIWSCAQVKLCLNFLIYNVSVIYLVSVLLAAAKYGKKVAVLDYVSPSTQGKHENYMHHLIQYC